MRQRLGHSSALALEEIKTLVREAVGRGSQLPKEKQLAGLPALTAMAKDRCYDLDPKWSPTGSPVGGLVAR